jgi:nucleoid-associated protein YgaU
MDRLAELKLKYQSVINLLEQNDARISKIELRNDKLYLEATCGSQLVKNAILDQVRSIDPEASDLDGRLTIDENLVHPTVRIYTVKQGDSLWKIAQEFLGNGALFPRIIAANPGRLKDTSSVIHPGDVLRIPEK